MMIGGMLYEKGAMLLMFQFYGSNGKPLLSFDCPFDVRLIPKDKLQLHSIDNAEQRLAIEIHVVDENNTVRVLRYVTMPPDMTLAFLSSVQEQLVELNNGQSVMANWMKHPIDQLIKQGKTWTMGR
ncbi:hypothetical protein VZ94_00535 [Methylocucumis oryzae]|uniref:Uncharacterized protein n=2 Tax=Methylocucumis oryzae TaxID=1632867 RepID=A0A0F3IR65_9GAMM|nr:hypothetical protein VZ94_00535 [Methylocucumis oryzae]